MWRPIVSNTTFFKYHSRPTLILYWVIYIGLSDYLYPVSCRDYTYSISNHVWRPIVSNTTFFKYHSRPTLTQYWILCEGLLDNLFYISFRPQTDTILNYLWKQFSPPFSSVLKGPHWYNIELFVKVYQNNCIQCLKGPTLIQWNHMWMPIRLPVSSIFQGPHWHNIEFFVKAIQTTCLYISIFQKSTIQ